MKDGKLQINVDGDEFHTLKPAGETSFHVADVPWAIRWRYDSCPPARKSRADWSRASGVKSRTYLNPRRRLRRAARNCVSMWALTVSEEIDPVYRIVLQDGNLSLTRLKKKAEVLRPAVRDVFTGDIGTVRFTRDSRQRISGLVLNAGRIRNFRFEKRVD